MWRYAKIPNFFFYDAYFGFYGGLKFGPPGVPPNLWKAITWPVVELERQSWCQSSSFGPKNLIQQKNWSKNFFWGVITPRGGYLGYPGVPSTVKFGKIQIEKETSWFFVSYSKIKNMCIDLLNTEKKINKWLVGAIFHIFTLSEPFLGTPSS